MEEKSNKKEIDRWKVPDETLFFRISGVVLTMLTSFVVFFIMFVLNNTKYYNRSIIKREKAPYIFASNHTTMFDSGFVDCAIFFPKGLVSYKYLPYHTPEYGNFYRNSFFSWYMDRVKCLPVERGKGIDQFSQKLVTNKLKDGNVVHIFPEGTRSRTGDLLPGKAGVGKRIYESRVKVIPCYHEGMRNILPVGTHFPRMGKKIRVMIGEPVFFDEFFEMENTPETWKAISEKIMTEITKLKEKLHELEAERNA